MKKLFVVSLISLFIDTAQTESNLEGIWIGASNPERIFKLTLQNDVYKAFEIDYSTLELMNDESFRIDPYKKIAISNNEKMSLLIMQKDIAINENGLVIYRDYANIDQKMYCLNDWQGKMPSSISNRVDQLRISAAKHCLGCNNNECKMKIWPEGNEKEQLLCKNIFCKPQKNVKKSIFMENDYTSGKNTAIYNYSINERGKIFNIEVLQTIGSMSKKNSEEYISELLKTQQYLPLIIENKSYKIINLRGSLSWNLRKQY